MNKLALATVTMTLFVGPMAKADIFELAPMINHRLETTDLFGNPISTINVGEGFQLRGYVEDARAIPQGVFAFWSDVIYTQALVSVPGAGPGPAPITFTSTFPNGRSGDTSTPGLIDEVGAFDGPISLGGGEYLLWTATFSANTAGLSSFTANPSELSPNHDAVLFGVDDPIGPTDVDYGFTTLTIQDAQVVVPEPTTLAIWSLLGGIGLVVGHRRRRRKAA